MSGEYIIHPDGDRETDALPVYQIARLCEDTGAFAMFLIDNK